MIADGERIKALLEKAEHRVLLCAPFIKAKVLQTILAVVPDSVPVQIITRWRANEVASGVSDLDVFHIVRKRPNTELRLLDALHAKLYLADEECLLGSANLTGSALGWSKLSNVEILVAARSTDSDVEFILKRLAASHLATFDILSEIEKAAANLQTVALDEGQDILDENYAHKLAWLPRCAAPDKLYQVYKVPETTTVIEETKEDGLSDLRDLQIQPGLLEAEFVATVRETLCLMPMFSRIIEEVPKGLTDQRGVEHIERSRPGLAQQDVQEQWRIVRDWIATFFGEEYEVAPASFITRIRSLGR